MCDFLAAANYTSHKPPLPHRAQLRISIVHKNHTDRPLGLFALSAARLNAMLKRQSIAAVETILAFTENIYSSATVLY